MLRAKTVGAAVLWTGMLLSAPEASASGYYNMPTSLQQCLGVGFGPGYHAPMLLGPCTKARIASQRLVRLPAPVPPPACGGFEGPSVWRPAPAAAIYRSAGAGDTPWLW